MDGSFELMDEGMAQGGRGHSVSDQTSLTSEETAVSWTFRRNTTPAQAQATYNA